MCYTTLLSWISAFLHSINLSYKAAVLQHQQGMLRQPGARRHTWMVVDWQRPQVHVPKTNRTGRRCHFVTNPCSAKVDAKFISHVTADRVVHKVVPTTWGSCHHKHSENLGDGNHEHVEGGV
eukprot:6459518-Amphidinium_carterae.1